MLFTLKPQRREVMIEVRELIDAELDGVCGGFFDVTELTNKIVANVQTNTQNGAAIGGSSFFGAGGAASLVQAASNTATTVIG
jgi:hypothetical protein